MILVIGATGTVGREVVAQLKAAGREIRLLTRDPSKVREERNVQVIVGDLSKPDSLPKALEGVERVFSLTTGSELAAQEGNLVRAAKAAGVRHVVKLSVLHAGDKGVNAIVDWHTASERAIQDSGLAWTFVRPGAFMSNALNWAGTVRSQGKVFSNFGEGRFAPVHPRDIAAVAVKALTSSGSEGKAYPVTGPQALTMAEQVRTLSEALGKPVEYVSVSDDAARDGMLKAGMPAVLVEGLLRYAAEIRSGRAADTFPTVEQVTGRKALTFAQWAQENASAFR